MACCNDDDSEFGNNEARSDGDNLSYDGSPVGYGKPPAKNQFRKGQKKPEGSGRRKGAKNRREMVREVLDEMVSVTENGRKREISTTEAILRRARARALSSNEILDHMRFFDLAQKLDPDGVDHPEPIPVQFFPGDDTI